MTTWSRPAMYNLLLIGTTCFWSGYGEEISSRHKIHHLRRRARFLPKTLPISGEYVPRFDLAEDSAFMDYRGFFSMPDSPEPSPRPTKSPVKPPTKEDRGLFIQSKCGVTAIERSRDILTELLMVSDALHLSNPETSQFKARDWLDNVDPAIICPENTARIRQRYNVALLYFELGGSEWAACRAEQDINISDDEEDCSGKPFLSEANECEWGGIFCGDDYDSATAEWLDAYYPLEVINLQTNNLKGELYPEFYEFTNLKEVFLNNNNLTGAISNDIGNLKNMNILQLEFNSFEGPVPEEGLFKLDRIAGLSIRGNKLTGSLDSMCNIRDFRRETFESYLALNMEADCLGNPPEVTCSCCTCF
eukprot:CAMPEP_0172401438 /NCGR_PEP_ID=MMETSP1061-20121228/50254_1 /TAXON_ID=37318 /ORGANISM="Pseudo-nitzschia pungens, Strain cf. pungens" /LENGTH=361 /DNA_ID=CAMNT_0013135079 /DNA_START=102 /DNA_END=1187 /DNA_ORIENTATION=+